jgi:hypothetical protein
MNKQEVANQLRAIFKPVEDIINDLTPDQLEQETAPGTWSIKDVLAHMTFWDQIMVNLLKSVLNLELRTVLSGSTEEINGKVYAENHMRPAAQVVADFKHTIDDLLAAAAMFSDDDLTQPGRFAIAKDQPMGRYIVSEVNGHYHEHIDELQQLHNQVAAR